MPVISVIVPIYKVEKYLRECIDSILDQSFSDFELILVDDGSPDHCPQICDDYKQMDNRIIVIHKENGGLSSARNAGLDYVFSNSDSKYITFVDSDDYVHKQYLECLLSGINESYAQIVVTKCLENVLDCSNRNPSKIPYLIKDKTECFDMLNCKNAAIVVAWGKLFSKSIFNNIRFPNGYIHEDEFIVHKIIFGANKICFIDDCLYFYRRREDSIMKNEALKNDDDYLIAIKDRLYFLLFNNIKTQAIWYTVNELMKHISLIRLNRLKIKDKTLIKETKSIIKKSLKELFFKRRLYVLIGLISPRFYLHLRSKHHL